jgi:hypothetical protein
LNLTEIHHSLPAGIAREAIPDAPPGAPQAIELVFVCRFSAIMARILVKTASAATTLLVSGFCS